MDGYRGHSPSGYHLDLRLSRRYCTVLRWEPFGTRILCQGSEVQVSSSSRRFGRTFLTFSANEEVQVSVVEFRCV